MLKPTISKAGIILDEKIDNIANVINKMKSVKSIFIFVNPAIAIAIIISIIKLLFPTTIIPLVLKIIFCQTFLKYKIPYLILGLTSNVRTSKTSNLSKIFIS